MTPTRRGLVPRTLKTLALPFLVVAGLLVIVALMVRRSRRPVAPVVEQAPVEEPVSVDA